MLRDAQSLLSMTLPALLQIRATEAPNRLALSARSGNGHRERLTYAQLEQRMLCAAQCLMNLGFSAGDRIGVFLTNDAGFESFVTALGAIAMGGAVVPLNTRYADPELRHALDLVQPSAVVATSADTARLQTISPGLRVLNIDDPNTMGKRGWLVDDQSDAHSLSLPSDPHTLACLLFTSGTTARAKAVMHTHRTMIGAGLSCGTALGLEPEDLYQAGWPFFTSSALNLGAMGSWVRGCSFVFEGVLDNTERLKLIESERGSYYHGVPSVIHFMVEQAAAASCDVSSLRRIGYGGSAMPGDVVARIRKQWPGVEQVQIYGLTESGPSGLVTPPEEFAKNPGAVGRAMPYCTIRILDDYGHEAAPGTDGEIEVEGPGVAVGYYRDPVATAAAFRGRAVRSGDVGRIDADGYVTFTDRKKDIINRGGLKVSSVAVESVLYQHPAVKEAAVVAVPHAALGEDVAACIVAREGAAIDLDAMVEFCRGKLADYSQPRHWLVLDELPKNPMGKILKGELRRLAGQFAVKTA